MFAPMTIQEAAKTLKEQLFSNYDDRESAAIADLVMEKLTTWRKADRILHKNRLLSPEQAIDLKKYAQELLLNKPVQYVLQEAWFCGMKFFVNDQVLIPRPETEELVQWAVETISKMGQGAPGGNPLSIVDVGTGSGCIAIALKKKLPSATVYACDISQGALEVASHNAELNQTDIRFIQMDFLDPDQRRQIPAFDCLISNPPYIPFKDRATMAAHVVGFEPSLALFVPDDRPLIFYEALGMALTENSIKRASLFAEIHEEQSEKVGRSLIEKGLAEIETRKDIQGKPRMIKAIYIPG
jgi:release factor glutamine methyltransferase